jgi:hypothetical protein
MRRSVVTAAVLAGLAAPVAAQPGMEESPPPPPQAAPQNYDWNDVSHINGSPVPVGERMDYLVVNPKKFNVSANPLGWLVGFYGLSGAVALSDNITLRGVRIEPELITSIYDNQMEDRVPVSLDAVPKVLTNAIIATEDRAFYSHE